MNDIDLLELRAFLNKHIEQTGSELAKDILKKEKDWSKMFTVFGGIANVTESDIDTAKAKITESNMIISCPIYKKYVYQFQLFFLTFFSKKV